MFRNYSKICSFLDIFWTHKIFWTLSIHILDIFWIFFFYRAMSFCFLVVWWKISLLKEIFSEKLTTQSLSTPSWWSCLFSKVNRHYNKVNEISNIGWLGTKKRFG